MIPQPIARQAHEDYFDFFPVPPLAVFVAPPLRGIMMAFAFIVRRVMDFHVIPPCLPATGAAVLANARDGQRNKIHKVHKVHICGLCEWNKVHEHPGPLSRVVSLGRLGRRLRHSQHLEQHHFAQGGLQHGVRVGHLDQIDQG
jgi:hypothetical protein